MIICLFGFFWVFFAVKCDYILLVFHRSCLCRRGRFENAQILFVWRYCQHGISNGVQRRRWVSLSLGFVLFFLLWCLLDFMSDVSTQIWIFNRVEHFFFFFTSVAGDNTLIIYCFSGLLVYSFRWHWCQSAVYYMHLSFSFAKLKVYCCVLVEGALLCCSSRGFCHPYLNRWSKDRGWCMLYKFFKHSKTNLLFWDM